MMQPLYVLYDDLVIGLLTHTQSGRLTFQYDTAWLENTNAFPLSVSMPLGSDLFPDNVTRPYFSGLLPEGPIRETVARKLGTATEYCLNSLLMAIILALHNPKFG